MPARETKRAVNRQLSITATAATPSEMRQIEAIFEGLIREKVRQIMASTEARNQTEGQTNEQQQ